MILKPRERLPALEPTPGSESGQAHLTAGQVVPSPNPRRSRHRLRFGDPHAQQETAHREFRNRPRRTAPVVQEGNKRPRTPPNGSVLLVLTESPQQAVVGIAVLPRISNHRAPLPSSIRQKLSTLTSHLRPTQPVGSCSKAATLHRLLPKARGGRDPEKVPPHLLKTRTNLKPRDPRVEGI